MISALRIGERTEANGFSIARVGLCGDAAYEVDGVAMPLDAAEVFAVRVPARPPVRAVRAARVRPETSTPELLVETRGAVRGRGHLNFEHRCFSGGEAVTITPKAGVSADLGAVLSAVLKSGLHAEWGAGGASIVVAWSKAALAPAPVAPKKKPATRGASRAVA